MESVGKLTAGLQQGLTNKKGVDQQGSATKKGVENVILEPKPCVKKETATQKRARENRGVSARNNPFKQQEAKSQIGITASAPSTSTSNAKVDAGSSNIEKLLKWIQKRVNQYPAVDVTNFTTSWEDGIALCALMNYHLGDIVIPPERVAELDKRARFEMALNAATEAGVPNYLRADELARGKLDRKSMITYLHAVYAKLFMEPKMAEKNAQ